MCADLAEVLNLTYSTKTLRYYLKAIDQGYKVEIINRHVNIIKTCEICENEFKVVYRRREQACCSYNCGMELKNKNQNNNFKRAFYFKKNRELKDKQLEIYCQLKYSLDRLPTQIEWVNECEKLKISYIIQSKSLPHKIWNDFENEAKYFNHKVINVIEDGEEDVYNGTVDNFHNFIIGGWESYTPFGRKIQIGVVSTQCGEIPLEAGFDNQGNRVREVCNISETFPTVCENVNEWYNACKYATFYCSTVSLLPTHQVSTNRVVARNRRIGIGLVGVNEWIENKNLSKVIKYLRKGYQIIRKENKSLANEAGVPESIRVTTVKPSGTVAKLVGKTPGIAYPNFEYMIRRVRVQRNHSIANILRQAGVPYEADYFSKNTDVFEFPLECGAISPVEEISLYQQAMNLVLLQREWADNSVSNTLMFKPKWKLIKSFSVFEGSNDPFTEAKRWINKNASIIDHIFFADALHIPTPCVFNYKNKISMRFDEDFNYLEIKLYEYDPHHEEDNIEPVLAAIAPLIKSVSLLPHSPKGAYHQQPEEGITKEEYEKRVSNIRSIDWSQLNNSDGQDEKYCQSDICDISNF